MVGHRANQKGFHNVAMHNSSIRTFLAGGVILNVLKEELPEEKKSRFLPFAFGAGVYTVLLLLL